MAFPAFLDTCTVFGGTLNDLFLTIAETRTYRPLWSTGVLDELERNLLKRGLAQSAVDRRINAMRGGFPDAEIRGYEDLIPQMTCDTDDRHVLAAAIRGDAAVLVTFNLRHFPAESLERYDIAAIHPDEFLLDQLDLHQATTCQAVRNLVSAYENPPLTTSALLAQLERAGVPKFAKTVGRLL